MGKQARILDFEEARSSSSRRTPTAKRGTTGKSSARGGSGTRGGSGARGGNVRNSNARSASSTRGSSSSRSDNARKQTSRSQASRTETSRRQASRSGAKKSNKRTSAPQPSSKLADAMRLLRKKKADRSFEKNVPQKASSESAPRAALYKTKMGRQHKKATKMQAGGKAGKAGQAAMGMLNFGAISLGKRGTIALLVCACLIAGCMLLYTPAKNYYVAKREQAKAEVALEIVSTRNAALEQDVAALSTEEGLEDRVREQYGWVKQGENAINVTGLEYETEPSAAEILRTVTLNDVKAPETWYSPLLDRVFGYAD